MKRISFAVLAAFVFLFGAMPIANAQPQHSFRTATLPLAAAVAASGPASSIRGVTVPVTFQVTSTTVSGTGTTVVQIQGSNDGTNWDSVGSAITLSTSSTSASGSFDNTSRYQYIRPNATTLTGTGAKYSATMGF